MAFTTVGGCTGKVTVGGNSVGEITKWSFDKENEITQFATSESNCYKRAQAGVFSGSGSIEGKFDILAAFPALQGATAADLKLYITATKFYLVPAVMKNFKVTVDIDKGETVGFTADFVANGQWTEPSLP